MVAARDEVDYDVETRLQSATYRHALEWYRDGKSLNVENTSHVEEFLKMLVYADCSPYILSNPVDGDELVVRLPITNRERKKAEELCQKFSETYVGHVDIEWGNRWLKIYYYGTGMLKTEDAETEETRPTEADSREVEPIKEVATAVASENFGRETARQLSKDSLESTNSDEAGFGKDAGLIEKESSN
jgi:hypothetical protein